MPLRVAGSGLVSLKNMASGFKVVEEISFVRTLTSNCARLPRSFQLKAYLAFKQIVA